MDVQPRPGLTRDVNPRQRRWAMGLDATVIALVVLGLVIAISGGLRVEFGDVRVTARGADRPLAIAVVLLLLRAWLARGAGWLGRAPGTARQLLKRVVDADAEPAVRPAFVWRARPLALSFGGIALATVVLLFDQLRRMDAVPDFGDPFFSMWRISWIFGQLTGDPRPLFDANIFHPARLTLTYSDAMLLPSLTAAPFIAAGLPLVTAYNVVLVSGFVGSAIAACLLTTRLTGSMAAGFVGGLLYGFYPFRFEHYSHLELQMTWWMPLGLLALHGFVERGRWRDVVAAALCLVAQLYSSMYYGVFFPLYVAAVFASLCVMVRPRIRRLLAPAAVAAVIAVALAVPLARPYVAAQEAKGDRDRREVAAYSATFADYLRPHHRSTLYAGRLLPEVHGERALFPGIAPLALTAIGLAPPLGAVRAAYAVGLVVAFDMSRGLNGILYPPLYDWVSPVRGMRVPARFSIILALSLAVLGAFGARRLLDSCADPRLRSGVLVALALAVGLDVHSRLDLTRVWPDPPAIYESLAGRRDVVLAEFPFGIDGAIDSLPQMYFSHWHRRAMINGYSGFFPADYQVLLDEVETFPDAASIAVLRARGVTHVTLTCALVPGECAPRLEAFAREPALRELTRAMWEGQPAVLWELLP